MIQIGPYKLAGRAVLAPMAGVTDVPFRQLCRQMGAAMVTAEMSASDPALRDTKKSQLRLTHPYDLEPRAIQIVGTDPEQMAMAARYQVEHGAQIVDINMGCPAKKVCKKLAGSALMKDEGLVRRILTAVVASVDVPVTLKMRTGWDLDNRNAVQIAQMAEDMGIASLAVHGRTRACRYHGAAEYDTIAAVVQAVTIPVFANGDITSAIKAKTVLDYTGADGVMIGRGAQGKPWIFREINDLLGYANASSELFTGKPLSFGDANNKERLIIAHLRHIHRYYNQHDNRCDSQHNNRQNGEYTKQITSTNGKLVDSKAVDNKVKAVIRPNLAVRMARKHICWYFEQIAYSIIEQYERQDERQQYQQEQTVTAEPKTLAAETTTETRHAANREETIRKTAALNTITDYSVSETGTIPLGCRLKPQEVTRLTDKIEIARKQFNQLSSCTAQLEHIKHFFGELQTTGDIAA